MPAVCFTHLTVHVIVTHPAGRDTGRVSTLELAGSAGGRRTVHLIRAIATVILTVTHKVLGNAAATGAGELAGGTGDVTCRTEGLVEA